MAVENNQPGMKKPLTLWEKAKIGVTSFVKTAMDYIPKGIVIGAAATGALMLIGNLTGMSWLEGVANLDLGGFVTRVATTVAIVTGLVGAIGAYQGIKAHTDYRNMEIEQQQQAIVRDRERARSRQQGNDLTDELEVKAQTDLPLAADKIVTGPFVG
ncbi:MAG: hypothetical protein AB7L92_06280 [Alphaproteobacteria bacterium]